MKFYITLTGEAEKIPKLYAAVLALVETMDAVPGIEISSVEVEEQDVTPAWNISTPYTYGSGLGQYDPTTTGVDNT